MITVRLTKWLGRTNNFFYWLNIDAPERFQSDSNDKRIKVGLGVNVGGFLSVSDFDRERLVPVLTSTTSLRALEEQANRPADQGKLHTGQGGAPPTRTTPKGRSDIFIDLTRLGLGSIVILRRSHCYCSYYFLVMRQIKRTYVQRRKYGQIRSYVRDPVLGL